MKPLVSVIIPTYNAASTISRAIASLMYQTYQNWECIVVDDGSSDNTEAIVKKFSQSKIKYFKNPVNKGRGYSRNFALKNVSGEFLCMLDADDWYLPEKLDRQIQEFSKRSDVGVVSCNMISIGRDGKVLGANLFGTNRETKKDLSPLKGPTFLPIPFAPSMIRTSLARDQGFNESLRTSEDFAFLLPILMKTPSVQLPYVGYAYEEESGLTYSKMIDRLFASTRIFATFAFTHPLSTTLNLTKVVARAAYYSLCFATGSEKFLLQRRTTKILQSEEVLYSQMQEQLKNLVSNPTLCEH